MMRRALPTAVHLTLEERLLRLLDNAEDVAVPSAAAAVGAAPTASFPPAGGVLAQKRPVRPVTNFWA